MLFILLFAACGLAIPVALEIYARGSDNILVRSGKELARSRVGKRLVRVTGRGVGGLQSILVLAFLFFLIIFLLHVASWVFLWIF